MHTSSFLNTANAEFISHLYTQYLKSPGLVDESWGQFFQSLNDNERDLLAELTGASWGTPVGNSLESAGAASAAASHPQVPTETPRNQNTGQGAAALPQDVSTQKGPASQETLDSIQALMLIRAYRVRGHLKANLDPLGIENRGDHPELDPSSYGFKPEDYDRSIFINGVLGRETATLREILEILETTYGGSIGVEFMHIQDPEQKSWIQRRLESQEGQKPFSAQEKKKILGDLTQAESFEKFLHVKYPGATRFGLDGGESLVPALRTYLAVSADLGVEEAMIGMSHRGRLNVLTNILNKPYRAVFSEFQGKSAYPDEIQGSGDVKYHMGASADEDFGGKRLHLSLNANPSHLEAVDPVVVGKVRAKQTLIGDEGRSKIMGILLHGDAAFAGQGLVAETLCLSELKGYKSGGTLHLVVNNQIGFTTSPRFSRSSPYCSDVAKMIQAPVFHVNGDDPEAVERVARWAAEFRQQFHKDVVLDLFCYRRHGHNEMDEPSFTQPLMYKAIRSHETTYVKYVKQLEKEGVLKDGEAATKRKEFESELQAEFEAAKDFKPEADWLGGVWEGFESHLKDGPNSGDTVVSQDVLQQVGQALTHIPESFALHPKLKRFVSGREKMLETGEGIDWAMGEALAFGTLLHEGTPVRLSGQDSCRGTFSQRHANFVDQETGKRHVSLNHITQDQAFFESIDSPLSEASVLGFEYGYASTDPHALVLWEAQFGDFANGAQVIIDQFITTGEMKWLRMNGLVLLLPHGYEGQGSEHSSARLERYLQLCGGGNIQVVNCTTPANYFHALRRQVRRNLRKPLIVMTPKSLLRHKRAISQIADMGPGSAFRRVIPELDRTLLEPQKINRVVLCSGKIYYDLLETREARKVRDVALIRVEQLYPFPADAISRELARYRQAKVIWCQEEPMNMGPWTFVDRRMEKILSDLGHRCTRPIYAGRVESASTATGLLSQHIKEQEELVKKALGIA
ncbi:MAG: 2-oxoglutarate dehydrogenase E1 component [bacterium]|nr:2-oxoglutarate dehydrogenase E1 component [bacterium]